MLNRYFIFAAVLSSLSAMNPAFALYEDTIRLEKSGMIDPNPTYLYAPTIMYDEDARLFKFWACGGVAGDYIVYKEATTLEGLTSSKWYNSLKPNGDGKFDSNHTCDPSVVKVGSVYFLYYGGLNDATGAGGIGVAFSTDGGKTFKRLNGGNPIITAPTYTGVVYTLGQPAVTRTPDGYFYMVYTGPNVKSTDANMTIIRSKNPLFLGYEKIKTTAAIGYSLDLTYNASRNQFVAVVNDVASNKINGKPNISVALVTFDTSFNNLGMTKYTGAAAGFRFGEGIGVLKNSKGEVWRDTASGRAFLTFVASTYCDNSPTCANKGWPEWVTGPVKYAMFSEGAGGVVTNLAGYKDIFLAGDLDKDGRKDIVFWRPSNGTWYYKLSAESYKYVRSSQWGLLGDTPLIGDFNKDSILDFAVYRNTPPNDQYPKWWILYDYRKNWSDVYGKDFSKYAEVQWGLKNDIPVPADYIVDGRNEITVWRPINGSWYVRYDGRIIQWGLNGDIPMPAEHDADKIADPAVFRPSSGKFYVLPSSGICPSGMKPHLAGCEK